ncbi:conserved exported protein of unknown function [Rhodovastum atsumiense]|uniref:DUF928 domain-containing protein n=1 Tax=Rhodovastum atsumiense TaxID=504468 RepID=A0A5M6IXK1_9PROT|nr:DUF928 domain-containing protein [Rhodovastum atsumiense]KAA5613080.1 DUF928 domain-containing protein [Rhodovastum atsumiense]CAH2600053.1 conserved exported protein of unknown function [Rhodovastum atsumiense]
MERPAQDPAAPLQARRRLWLGLLAMCVVPPAAAQPKQDTPPASAKAGSGNESPRTIRYVPRHDRGAPESRVSGGTRGQEAGQMRIDVLAPRQVGLTLQPQPTLYWFSSRPVTAQVEITLVIDDATNRTILKTPLPGPLQAGIHGFPLAATRARLTREVDYQWTVTIVLSPQAPSRNIVASGMIRQVGSAPGESTITANRPDAAAYALAGIWYDAVDALCRDIALAPGDRQLRLQRAFLLDQVGLHEAAAFDRQNPQP